MLFISYWISKAMIVSEKRQFELIELSSAWMSRTKFARENIFCYFFSVMKKLSDFAHQCLFVLDIRYDCECMFSMEVHLWDLLQVC